jgi:hypothetical protein
VDEVDAHSQHVLAVIQDQQRVQRLQAHHECGDQWFLRVLTHAEDVCDKLWDPSGFLERGQFD